MLALEKLIVGCLNQHAYTFMTILELKLRPESYFLGVGHLILSVHLLQEILVNARSGLFSYILSHVQINFEVITYLL